MTYSPEYGWFSETRHECDIFKANRETVERGAAKG